MTKGEHFFKNGNFKRGHCSAMSSSAWCDLNTKRDILNLHDIYPSSTWKCQNQFIFTPRQFQLEGAGLESSVK